MIHAPAAPKALSLASAFKQPEKIELDRERQLIHAAQQGNEQAFSQLYEAQADAIYRYLLFRVDSPTTAQDLTAEVFLRVVEGLPDYQSQGRPFLAWLYRIAHARLVDHYRQLKRAGQPQDVDTTVLSVEDDPDNGLMTNYHQRQIHEALGRLSPEQQQVITLRFVEDYSLQKTADQLGKTVGAVKVMQHRALQALSRMLKSPYADDPTK